MAMIFVLSFFVGLICAVVAIDLDTDPYHTPVIRLSDNSPIRGRVKTLGDGKKVMEFLGIPYAEPPVGVNRFKRPRPVEPWTEILDAYNFSAACYQVVNHQLNYTKDWFDPKTMKMSEDCLYLNVWVPGEEISPSSNFPVLFWIHGGYFMSGSAISPRFDGSILANEEQIIVVTINYRLAVFGFLYTGSLAAPGNAGLLDQLEALKWVNRHIYRFGGDRNSITLCGVSAGGESAGFHALSPLSRKHFTRFIMESGTPLIPNTIFTNHQTPRSKAVALGSKLGCRVQDEQNYTQVYDMVECMQKETADRLLKASLMISSKYELIWIPVVDGHFLTEDPTISLRRGDIKRTEVLLGSNLNEGASMLATFLPIIYRRDMIFNESYEFIKSVKIFKQVIKLAAPKTYAHNFVIHNELYFEYNDWKENSAKSRHRSMDKMVGDYYFTCPTSDFAKLYSDNGRRKVYQYLYTHHSSLNSTPSWMGAVHTEEVPFVFGHPLRTNLPKNYTTTEIGLSKRMMRYWANFARTGDPNQNKDGTRTEFKWPEYGTNKTYLIIAENSTSTDMALRQRQCVFWGVHIPNLKRYTDSCGID